MLKRELLHKANQILDETKEEQGKYHEERITIFKLLENLDNKFNLEILENIIKIYEKNNLIVKNIKYKKLNELIQNIEKQEIRREDGNTLEHIVLFLVEDKLKNRYSFFTRKNAKRFVQENSEKFEKDCSINVIKNENIDLEKILM